MDTEPIPLLVDREAAQAFWKSSPQEREQLGLELGLWLKRRGHQPTPEDKARFVALVREIGTRAPERGLTPEILESILDE